MRESENQWKADTDLEMANHCMELAALRQELDDLKLRHNYAVAATIAICHHLKLKLEEE